MLKPKRAELIKHICKKCGLPSGKKTDGFFTREQLVELSIWIDRRLEIRCEVDYAKDS